MKKRKIRKLTLDRETLRRLDPSEMGLVAGGAEAACLTAANCQTASCPNRCTESCVTCAAAECSDHQSQ